MKAEHTSSVYSKELKQLDHVIEQMGTIAESQLNAALEAISTHDVTLAAKVAASDDHIDQLEESVGAFTVRLLSLRQPVAFDLRHIISALKISIDLERIADYAANVAGRVGDLDPVPPEEPLEVVVNMGKLVQQMINGVLDAYRKEDVSRAIAVWRRDREVDALYTGLLATLRTCMMEDPGRVSTCSHLLLIARSMERMGDHIKNISEHIYYMVRGEPFHYSPDGSEMT